MDAEDDECAAARAEAAADGPPGAVPIPGNILHVHTYDRPKNSGKLVGCTCMTCVLLVRYLPAEDLYRIYIGDLDLDRYRSIPDISGGPAARTRPRQRRRAG